MAGAGLTGTHVVRPWLIVQDGRAWCAMHGSPDSKPGYHWRYKSCTTRRQLATFLRWHRHCGFEGLQ